MTTVPQCVKGTAKFGGLSTIWGPANCFVFFGGGASHDLEGPVPPTPGPSVEPPLAGKCAIGRVRPFALCHLTHLTIGVYTHAKYLYTLHVYGT